MQKAKGFLRAYFSRPRPPTRLCRAHGGREKGLRPHKNNGRSMIEMLGVLAIIGVLSAGGIMGYSAAMDAYTFNKFVKDIQTMTGAVISVFPKPHNHSNTVTWQGQDLNKLGILPNDLYKTAPNPTSNYVKNPFTGKMDWCIMLYEGYQTELDRYTSNLGSYSNLPEAQTLLHFGFIVSQRDCIKIVTHNWNSPSWYFIINRTTYPGWTSAIANAIVGPVSMDTAKSWCKKGTNYLNMNSLIHARKPVWQ